MRPSLALAQTIALALSIVGARSWADEKPQCIPGRDVDIVYAVTRGGQSTISERVRWLASDHLERIDGPDKSATIIDEKAKQVTLLNSSSRTYNQMDGGSPWPIATPREPWTPARRGESVVAGLRCTDWSWTDDWEARVACFTADGVLLRLLVDGKTRVEALSVRYITQDMETFLVPPGYAPAVMAPEAHRLLR